MTSCLGSFLNSVRSLLGLASGESSVTLSLPATIVTTMKVGERPQTELFDLRVVYRISQNGDMNWTKIQPKDASEMSKEDHRVRYIKMASMRFELSNPCFASGGEAEGTFQLVTPAVETLDVYWTASFQDCRCLSLALLNKAVNWSTRSRGI